MSEYDVSRVKHDLVGRLGSLMYLIEVGECLKYR